jgi:hypothetical protein
VLEGIAASIGSVGDAYAVPSFMPVALPPSDHCPGGRNHGPPVAGRFFLGIGSGERLNEHIVGRGWHSVSVRHEMLREALQIIEMLWSGGFHSFNGKHLQLEDARIYDLPDELPEIIVAASGTNAAHRR